MRIPWQTAKDEAFQALRALLRLDTSNPPGNERIATDYIAQALARHGLEPTIKESAPTRANLVARIKGASPTNAPILLSSHTDVVPVEPSGWSRPAFAAEIADGCVWGRGSLDMKSKSAMDIVMMTALARSGVRPNRDVIMAAVADEEAGSDHGAKFLVDRHPELVRAGWVLNEVGGFTIYIGNARFYPIQVAEKGIATIKMTVTGQPGHGSMPRRDTAIAGMAALLTKLTNTPMPMRVTPFMERMLRKLGVPLDNPGPLFRPMMGNTVTPTILRAGYKDNVIPGEASVVLDGRTVPGADPESFVAELRAIVGPEPRLELIKSAPSVETSADTELFDLIRDRVEEHDPGARAIPWMIPGATDNKFYARLGAKCYGFVPVKLDPHLPFGSLFHGNDERLPIDGFYWGLRVYAEVVLSFIGVKFDEVFA